VCGPFNVVIVIPGDTSEVTWGGRAPTHIIRDGAVTFFRYVEFQGAAEGCP